MEPIYSTRLDILKGFDENSISSKIFNHNPFWILYRTKRNLVLILFKFRLGKIIPRLIFNSTNFSAVQFLYLILKLRSKPHEWDLVFVSPTKTFNSSYISYKYNILFFQHSFNVPIPFVFHFRSICAPICVPICVSLTWK
jgi:hypothetical protein